MGEPITADDVLPLIAKLSPAERIRLFRLAKTVASDAEAYRASPPGKLEFGADDDSLSWDADGWENVE